MHSHNTMPIVNVLLTMLMRSLSRVASTNVWYKCACMCGANVLVCSCLLSSLVSLLVHISHLCN